MIRFLSTLFLTAALAACGTTGSVKPSSVAYGCATVAAAAKVIKVGIDAGRVTVDQQRGVRAALAVTTPVCTASPQPTLTQTEASLFAAAVALIQARAAGAN